MARRRKKKNVIVLPFWAFVTIIIIVGICFGIWYFLIYSKNTNEESTTTTEEDTKEVINSDDGYNENIIYDNFQIHFLELGNDYAGDSVYIKANNYDILIDAGSRGNSATYINEYVKNYCNDGKLEYVIATHSHQDHIAGFAGVNGTSKTTNYKGENIEKTGVLYYYDVDTFIDFTYASAKLNGEDKEKTFKNKEQKSEDFSSSSEYGKYLKAREYIIDKGTSYKNVEDLWNNNEIKFEFGNNISMDILYNYYYFNESSDINNYSVCVMLNYNDKYYMLTGDLEKEGEEYLADYYDGSTKEKTLPHVELFKAGHHGSKTSSNDCLLDKITPSICVACCCAGSTEYTINNDAIFPTQDFINRIAKHTFRVYVTSLFDRDTLTNVSFNGNIIISSDGKDIGINASNNLIKLKDTEWFNEEIYLVDGEVASGTKGSKEFYNKDTVGGILTKQRTWPSYGKV